MKLSHRSGNTGELGFRRCVLLRFLAAACAALEFNRAISVCIGPALPSRRTKVVAVVVLAMVGLAASDFAETL